MATVPDLSQLDDETRRKFATFVQGSDDFELPENMKFWNYEPCEDHTSIEEGMQSIPVCRKCGVIPFPHQRVAGAWSYLEKKVLLADTMGLGKTGSAAVLLSLMYESGELDDPSRKVVICINPSALTQWSLELKRMLSNVDVVMHTGVKSKRIARLTQTDWQVCLVGYQTLNKDLELFRAFNIYCLLIDDVEPIIHNKTQTHYNINELARNAERVHLSTGTPISKKLLDLYNTMLAIGGREILGSPTSFERRFVKFSFGKVYNVSLHRDVLQRTVSGYQNIEELKERIQPKVLRRTARDVSGIELPKIVSQEIYLPLSTAQRVKYEELKQGAIKILKESGGFELKTRSQNAYSLGQMIVDGLAFLGEQDLPGINSSKLDKLMAMVTGDLSEEKIVCFINFKNGIRAFQSRLDAEGIGYSTIWGENNNPKLRQEEMDRFWNDEDTRILMGTSSIEKSLNCQIARHLVYVDTIPSPSRMSQISGRIARLGSSWATCYLHILLTEDTQESRYMAKLTKESAIADSVLNDESQIFGVDLSPEEKLQLIIG